MTTMIATLKKLEACDNTAWAVEPPIDRKGDQKLKHETKPDRTEFQLMSVPSDGWLSGGGRRLNFA
ncbi:MAG: hypothetical protein WD075_08910 [Rhodospirillales bacterium]